MTTTITVPLAEEERQSLESALQKAREACGPGQSRKRTSRIPQSYATRRPVPRATLMWVASGLASLRSPDWIRTLRGPR